MCESRVRRESLTFRFQATAKLLWQKTSQSPINFEQFDPSHTGSLSYVMKTLKAKANCAFRSQCCTDVTVASQCLRGCLASHFNIYLST